jgi:hypothetical protein
MVNAALTRDWASGHFAEFDQCPLCPRKRTLFTAARMSALPPKAHIVHGGENVRFVPQADSCTATNSGLFDHLVGRVQ